MSAKAPKPSNAANTCETSSVENGSSIAPDARPTHTIAASAACLPHRRLAVARAGRAAGASSRLARAPVGPAGEALIDRSVERLGAGTDLIDDDRADAAAGDAEAADRL